MPSQCWAHWHQVNPASSEVLRRPVAGLWGSWESTSSFPGASQTFKAAPRGSETWASRQPWRQPGVQRAVVAGAPVVWLPAFLCRPGPRVGCGSQAASADALSSVGHSLSLEWVSPTGQNSPPNLPPGTRSWYTMKKDKMRRNCLDWGGATYITAGVRFIMYHWKPFQAFIIQKNVSPLLGVWPKEMNIHVSPEDT